MLQNNKYEELKTGIRIRIIYKLLYLFATGFKSNSVRLCCKTTNVMNKNSYHNMSHIQASVFEKLEKKLK